MILSVRLRLLIGGASSKFFHLKELGDALTEFNIEYKLVHDVEVVNGFPSRNIKDWFQTLKKFNELVEEFRPDAVFVDRQVRFGLAAVKANLPLLVHLRGDYWSEIKWARETLYKDLIKRNVLWWKNRIAEKCFTNSTHILPICDYLSKIVKTRYPEKPITTFHQGIDPKRWYHVDGMELKHPCVGLLQSSMIWGKTQEMLILKDILEAFPNVTFYWVGDGPYRKDVLPLLSKHDNFKWLGSMQYPDKIREYLSEIDVYALISGIDMSPLTLLEAQLMKKPVIATNVGGIPELMKDHETGFLVEKGNQGDLIEKLSILLNDSKKAKLMGDVGKQFVEDNFSWNKIAKNLVSVLKTVK